MKLTDITEEYNRYVFNRLVIIAPAIGLLAAVSLTLCRIFGLIQVSSTAALVVFDAVCLSYGVVSLFLRKKVVGDGEGLSAKTQHTGEIILSVLCVVHWNMISYIVPFGDFWGYGPLFVMLTAFFFTSRIVAYESFGIVISVLISWLLPGANNILLPAEGNVLFYTVFIRGLCLILSFFCAYLLTYYSERFKKYVNQYTMQLSKQNDLLRSQNRDIIAFTADVLEKRDVVSGSHTKRVREITLKLGQQLMRDNPDVNLTEEEVQLIAEAGVLHDVGKIAISDAILNKPGPLTKEEFDVMKRHPVIGREVILKMPPSLGDKFINLASDICLCHHEKVDGSGYPRGLKGEEISLAAQMVSLADAYDAMTSDRPYRKAYTSREALERISRGECGAFQPNLIEALSKIFLPRF